jgi:sortase (surface protein transpeptidase)
VAITPRAIGSLVPTRIDYNGINALSSLQPEGLNPDKTLQTPDVQHPEQAGWYSQGPVPGEVGPAIVMGHINGGGKPGVFNHLAEAQPGQMVSIDRSDGKIATFKVARVAVIPKSRFPKSQVYSDTKGPELRLISCGGALDRDARSYESNVIVWAVLDSLR